PPPPLSLLFPYPTLFRSAKPSLLGAGLPTPPSSRPKVSNGSARQEQLDETRGPLPLSVIILDRHGNQGAAPANVQTMAALFARLDRKSTRLNSSHEWISY